MLAIPAGVALVVTADSRRAAAAAAIFALTVAAMFGASALYHRPTKSARRRRVLRRLDHAGIFALIAGTYTPWGLLVLTGTAQVAVLTVVWAGAGLAIAVKLLWHSGPDWLTAAIAVALGWVGVAVLPDFVDGAGLVPSLLVLAGGLAYTLGALVYVARRPNPLPDAFGYHEVFHALVVAAVAFQYASVALILRAD